MRQRLAISPVLCTFDPYNSEAALVNTLIAMNTTHLVYLIGARASGKTTVGRMLARRLGLPFVDTDAHVVAALGEAIADLVAREGWPAFRQHESASLVAASATPAVVATGGGMVLDPANCTHMRKTGTVIYLDVPASALCARLAADPLECQRPSLTGRCAADEIADVLLAREPLYKNTAHHIVDGVRPVDDVVEDICNRLSSS